MTRVSRLISKWFSIEGVPSTRERMVPLFLLERGFQARTCSGPGYFEWQVRPVRALIVFGRPRLFLVSGIWTAAEGWYDIPNGPDFLDEVTKTDASYLRSDDPQVRGLDWHEAAARKPTESVFLRPDRDEDAYELLLEANALINTVVYHGVLGRESNNWLFPDEYCPLHLVEWMISQLDALREIYTADRDTIKAWKSERLQAHDTYVQALETGTCGEAETERWLAIVNTDPRDYKQPRRRLQSV